MTKRGSFFPKILITAGPTREMLDPVRFLSNHSTGTMGYEMARCARARGLPVTLVSGPTALKPPRGVRRIEIESSADLAKVCRREFSRHDVLIMSAAVCDFTAARCRGKKMRRMEGRSIRLKRTPDIVAGLARQKGRRTVIGFCLESGRWVERAKGKMRRKRLDGIVANYYTERYRPFGDRLVTVALLDGTRSPTLLKRMNKRRIAEKIVTWACRLASLRTRPASALRPGMGKCISG